MTSDPPRSLHFEASSTSSAPSRTSSSSSTLKGFSKPLANKVTAVLSSSYADSEFRDSLALLDDRHVQNTAETRRRLRLDIQKEVIESNGEVIAEFGRVAEQLRRIGSTIEALSTTYSSMKAEITAAHSATKPVLDEASVLIDRRRNVETRRRLLSAFIGHFVLTEDEVAILTLTAEPLDDRFFAVLNKAKKISTDCEILLGFEDNPSLGPEIMEQTSRNINLGFQKLYKWVQKEFRHLNLENPQISSSMSRALRVLAERPALFQSYLNSFSEARESILSDAFYTALTGSNESGSEIVSSIKPIELAAHDPLRYAGDMLAWMHSATVSEREALEALFVGDGGGLARGIQEGRETEAWLLASEEESADAGIFDPVKALNDLVDRDLSGVTRILRQRMTQVIQNNEETILAYKLANLLNFYRLTFGKLLGAGVGGNNNLTDGIQDKPGLVETLSSLESEALRHFRSLVRDHVATLRGRLYKLQETIDSKARALVEHQYSFLCHQSGLEDMFVALGQLSAERKEDLEIAVGLDVLQPQTLVEISQYLDDFLPSALVDAIDNLKALQDPKRARQVTEEAAERFCVDFEHVEKIIVAADELLSEKDEDKDPDTALRALLPRTSVEIRVLLS
ncbi:golgi transport complex subunit [Grosmannia clavigera kw1407]|uniref:Conserved oligomeric Golgi complex subunit 6 n=1 Tax=Grosmannia clavigera (strain kw1407 / UAMH 11150) TaxID=655863 RepID=F0XNF7_GROCL|nr:golgi transport complex subunit [Grosmannia clavigera kw1407]EFX00773.1 golgi transport complex subunit [Grosmannia clavigera kw1407]